MAQKITFRIVPHRVLPGKELVEVCIDGKTVGAIYADERMHGIKIVSMHMVEPKIDPDFKGRVVTDDGSTKFPPVPAVHITFNPSPWYLSRSGFVVKPSTN